MTLNKALGKHHTNAGTHAHYAGEFGAQPMTKKLEKDPEYRAARAQYFAKIAKKAAQHHASATDATDRAQYALAMAHAAKMAAKHAHAVKKIAPTRHALIKTATEAREYAAKRVSNIQTKSSATIKNSGSLGAQKLTSTNSKNPIYRAARAEHFAKIAKDALDKHTDATSKSTKAAHALEAVSAIKLASKHAKAVHDLVSSNNPLHSKAKHIQDSVKSMLAGMSSGYPGVGKHTLSASAPNTKGQSIGREMSESIFSSFRNAYKKTLSSYETEAVLAYSGSAYEQINKGLRNGSKVNANVVKRIDSAISKSSVQQTTLVFRGAGGPNAVKHFKNMKIGDAYIEKGYSSTSARKGSAFPGRVVMHITIPKGGKGAPIPSEHPIEREILLPRNQKFMVDNIEHSTTSNGKERLILHLTAIQR